MLVTHVTYTTTSTVMTITRNSIYSQEAILSGSHNSPTEWSYCQGHGTESPDMEA